jgi:hypothetical protein
VGESEEGERTKPTRSTLLASQRGEAAELDHARLLFVELKAKVVQPLLKIGAHPR